MISVKDSIDLAEHKPDEYIRNGSKRLTSPAKETEQNAVEYKIYTKTYKKMIERERRTKNFEKWAARPILQAKKRILIVVEKWKAKESEGLIALSQTFKDIYNKNKIW